MSQAAASAACIHRARDGDREWHTGGEMQLQAVYTKGRQASKAKAKATREGSRYSYLIVCLPDMQIDARSTLKTSCSAAYLPMWRAGRVCPALPYLAAAKPIWVNSDSLKLWSMCSSRVQSIWQLTQQSLAGRVKEQTAAMPIAQPLRHRNRNLKPQESSVKKKRKRERVCLYWWP